MCPSSPDWSRLWLRAPQNTVGPESMYPVVIAPMATFPFLLQQKGTKKLSKAREFKVDYLCKRLYKP